MAFNLRSGNKSSFKMMGSSAVKRTADYSTETGRRLSRIEADELIEDEGAGAVTSTYEDAIRRAKTDEERKAAETRMTELSKTEEGRRKIYEDAAETERLEGTYDEGAEYDEMSWNPDQEERAKVEAWSGEGADPRQEGGLQPTTDAEEKKKAVIAAEKKKAIEAINKKYTEPFLESDETDWETNWTGY